MSELELQCDDGALASSLARDRLPVDGPVLLATAVLVALAGAGLAPAGPAWPWALAGLALALASVVARPRPRLAWTRPALLRALEYGTVLALVGSSPWAYALLAALAFHHYDIVYRARIRGTAPPRCSTLVAGGWELRLGLLVLAAALGVAEPAAAVLAPALAGLRVAESAASWTA